MSAITKPRYHVQFTRKHRPTTPPPWRRRQRLLLNNRPYFFKMVRTVPSSWLPDGADTPITGGNDRRHFENANTDQGARFITQPTQNVATPRNNTETDYNSSMEIDALPTTSLFIISDKLPHPIIARNDHRRIENTMQAEGVAFITPTPENGDPSMNTLISDDVFPRVSNARSATFHLTINSVTNINALADCDRHHVRNAPSVSRLGENHTTRRHFCQPTFRSMFLCFLTNKRPFHSQTMYHIFCH